MTARRVPATACTVRRRPAVDRSSSPRTRITGTSPSMISAVRGAVVGAATGGRYPVRRRRDRFCQRELRSIRGSPLAGPASTLRRVTGLQALRAAAGTDVDAVAIAARARELGVLGWVRPTGELHAEGAPDAVAATVALLGDDVVGAPVKVEGHEHFGIRGVPAGSFVVSEAARGFVFSLEVDGAPRSWTLAKAPSMDPAVKRMAFEGEAEGTAVWDSGSYEQGGRVAWPEANRARARGLRAARRPAAGRLRVAAHPPPPVAAIKRRRVMTSTRPPRRTCACRRGPRRRACRIASAATAPLASPRRMSRSRIGRDAEVREQARRGRARASGARRRAAAGGRARSRPRWPRRRWRSAPSHT